MSEAGMTRLVDVRAQASAERTAPIAEQHVAPADKAALAAPVTVVERRDLDEDGSLSIRRPLGSIFSVIKTHLSEMSSLVLNIAAATPGEGASTVARELAHQAGQTSWCRTLLLDGNAGNDDQAMHFGLSTLPHLGIGTEDPARIEIVRIGLRQAHFDLAGVTIGGAQESNRIEPSALRDLYVRLRRTYALIVVDCPPILTSPDTAVFSSYADGVLLVVAAERTRIPVVSRARQDVEDAGGTVKGIVLNRRRHYIPKFIYNRL